MRTAVEINIDKLIEGLQIARAGQQRNGHDPRVCVLVIDEQNQTFSLEGDETQNYYSATTEIQTVE